MSDRHEQEFYERRRPRSGKCVCATCLEDEPLQQFANQRGAIQECDYCGQTPTTRSVVSLDEVVEVMGNVIAKEWCDPGDDAPYRSAEGGYQVDTIDNDELLYKIGFEVSNPELMADISVSFADHKWCLRDWQLLLPSQRLAYGWDRFQHVVKHQQRYTFWYSRDDLDDMSHPDDLPPADMLGEIEAAINRTRLVKLFPVGTLVWRLQSHSKDEILSTPERFTSPPIHAATKPNRMSPAGVPMFYGADDFHTALLEVFDPADPGTKGESVSGALFRATVPLNLLDLTAIPSPPSYLSPEGPPTRHAIDFLRGFVKTLSQPIKRDGLPHIEYVPTQVLTEFVRHIMKDPGGAPVHGIRYSSSRNDRPCCVIFATQAECLRPRGIFDTTKQKLEFVPGSIKTVDATEVSCGKAGDFLAEVKASLGETGK